MISEETRKKWKEKIETIYQASEVNQIEFNDWEGDFFDSIYQQIMCDNKDLSWKQSQALNRLYEKIG